jgi:hypothetical protein
MHSRIVAGCLLSASVLFVGCVESHSEFTPSGSVSAGLVDSAWLAGDMIGVGEFAGDAYEISAYSENVTIHVGRRGGESFGWAMISLSVSGDYDPLSGEYEPAAFEDLEPGTHLDSSEPSDITVQAIGCSGPNHGEYVFDGAAERVVVDVEQGAQADERLVHFSAEYADGQVAYGSFAIRAQR